MLPFKMKEAATERLGKTEKSTTNRLKANIAGRTLPPHRNSSPSCSREGEDLNNSPKS